MTAQAPIKRHGYVPPRAGISKSRPPDWESGFSPRRGQYGGDMAFQALAATIGKEEALLRLVQLVDGGVGSKHSG